MDVNGIRDVGLVLWQLKPDKCNTYYLFALFDYIVINFINII